MSNEEVFRRLIKNITFETLYNLAANGADSFIKISDDGVYQLIYKGASDTDAHDAVFYIYTPHGAQIVGKLKIKGGIESLPKEGSLAGDKSVLYKAGARGYWNLLPASGGSRKLKRTRRNRRKNRKSRRQRR